MCVHARAHVQVRVFACVRACVCVCLCACLCVCDCVCVGVTRQIYTQGCIAQHTPNCVVRHACTRARTRTRIRTVRAHMYVYTHICCIHTYMFTQIYVYTHIRIHTTSNFKDSHSRTQVSFTNKWPHATHCNMLQHTATRCNTTQAIHGHRYHSQRCGRIQQRCGRIQLTATHGNTLQHNTTIHGNIWQHTATCCNTLRQLTATHGNTLQHAATHYCNILQAIQGYRHHKRRGRI